MSFRMFTVTNPDTKPIAAQVAEVMDPEAGFCCATAWCWARNPNPNPATVQVAEVMDLEAGFLLRDSVVLAVEVLECCPWCACDPVQHQVLPQVWFSTTADLTTRYLRLLRSMAC